MPLGALHLLVELVDCDAEEYSIVEHEISEVVDALVKCCLRWNWLDLAQACLLNYYPVQGYFEAVPELTLAHEESVAEGLLLCSDLRLAGSDQGVVDRPVGFISC